MARSKRSFGERDDSYLRSAWDYAQHIRATYGCAVGVALVPLPRVGCWEIRTQAEYLSSRGPARVVARYDTEHPRGYNDSLSGAIWAALMKLEHEVQLWAGQEELPF